jgi:hypothetical protein
MKKMLSCLCLLLLVNHSACDRSPKWGKVAVGKDSDGHWEAFLENNRISVRYGFKMSGENQEGMITRFVHKDYRNENIAGHLLDAAAHRGLITDAVVVEDGAAIKTIRITWEATPQSKSKFPGTAVSDISIFPDSEFIRIDYHSYCFPHVCDIGAPGGLDCPTTDTTCGGRYVIYGAHAWQETRAGMTVDSLINHPNPHHRVTDDLYPLYPNPLIDRDWGETPMDYQGWYIMGVYAPENGRGYGRIMPAETVPYIKLLWNKGFELFPCWRSDPEPHTEYLFVVTRGEKDIIETGKRLVDRAIREGV